MADYELPDDCRYTKEDEWVRLEDDELVVGVTDYAQQQLGDIVFLELPDPGSEVNAGEAFGVIESVKAVSELFAPLGGVIVESNAALEQNPELVNESCYEDGWIARIAPNDAEEFESLLTAEEYKDYIDERAD